MMGLRKPTTNYCSAKQMKTRLSLAIIGLRISNLLYAAMLILILLQAFSIFNFIDGLNLWALLFLMIVTLGLVVFIEIVIACLRRHKYWAWVAGLIIGAIYLPSLYLPFGVLILIGLLSGSTRLEFESLKTKKVESC